MDGSFAQPAILQIGLPKKVIEVVWSTLMKPYNKFNREDAFVVEHSNHFQLPSIK